MDRAARRPATLRGDGDAEGAADRWPHRQLVLASLFLRVGGLAQQQQGELERTQQQQNRIRLLPSLRAISEMEQAICWPAQYLGRLPDLLRAVNAVALAHSLNRDAGWVSVKRGGYGDTWRQRHDAGCSIIAQGLRACRTPVF
jgi:hypothetical protein